MPDGYEEAGYLIEAIVGNRYKVTWDDCCASGNFEAVLARKNYEEDIPGYPPYITSLTFTNGVTISGHGVWLGPAE